MPAVHPNNQRDKESVFVTKTGRVLICTNDYINPTNMLAVYRSDDNGASWLPPVVMKDAGGGTLPGGNCNGFGQAPDGSIYFVGYSRGTEPDLLDMDVVVSRDNGDSWTVKKVQGLNWPLSEAWTAEAMVIYPKATWPTVAVDPTNGDVAIAGTEWDFQRNRWWSTLHRSIDDGETFTRIALPVPPEAGCSGCHLSSPLVAYDAKGRLALQTMLFSNDGGMTKEQWLQVSPDDGSTWLQPFLAARTSGVLENWTNPLTWAPRNVQSVADQHAWLLDHLMDADGVSSSHAAMGGGVTHHLRLGGDYWGMVASDEGFLSMWNDHKGGYSQIWSRLIAVDE